MADFEVLEKLRVAQEQLSQFKSRLAKAENLSERQRRFIIEQGHSAAYIIWMMRQDGMDEEFVKAIEDGAHRSNEQKEDGK